MVRTIYQQLSPAEVHGQLDRVVEQLREPFPQVAELPGRRRAGSSWPSRPSSVAHWQKLWSNNPQERLNREIRRRTDVVGIYPNRCPASTIFAGWRQSVLPVHLLGLAPLLGSIGPVAGDVKLQDDGVVHDPVNRRGGGHGVGEDALPLREDQV